MVKWLKSFVKGHHYTHGKTINPDTGEVHGENRRINNRTGRLELLLWKEGEKGHSEDYWHECGDGWVDWFVPDP